MARSGRRRKFRGSRPGPDKTASQKQPDDRVRATRQPHRRALDEEHRTKEEAESPLGRLLLAGLLRRADDRDDTLSRDRLLAAELFASAVGAYRSVIEAPRDVAGSGRGYPCTPGLCATDDEKFCECLTRRRRYEAAYEALADHYRGVDFWVDHLDEPLQDAVLAHRRLRENERWQAMLRERRRALMAVIKVAIHREAIAEAELVYLTIGLDKLVRHFGLTDRRSKSRATIAVAEQTTV